MGTIKSSARLQLNGVWVQGLAGFRHYFDFGQFYRSIIQNKREHHAYRCFVNGLDSCSKMMLLGHGRKINGPDYLEVVEKPGRWREMTQEFFIEVEGQEDCVRVHLKELLSVLNEEYACIFENIPRDRDKSCWLDVKTMARNMEQLLNTVTREGTRVLYACAGIELIIYCMTVCRLGIDPLDKSNFAILEEDMKSPVIVDTLEHDKDIMITKEMKQDVSLQTEKETGKEELLELPLFSNEKEFGSCIELVRLDNQREDQSWSFVLKGTVISATAEPGQCVYALRTGGKYLCFLPQDVIYQDHVMQRNKQGKLVITEEGGASLAKVDVSDPACWAYSPSRGVMVFGGKQKLDINHCEVEEYPELPLVMVTASGDNYSLLQEDGSVLTRFPRRGWAENPIIWVHEGLNTAVAIDITRRARLGDGSILPPKNVMTAYSWNKHTICLSAEGEVWTDSELSLNENACAVGICSRGYLISTGKEVQLYGFDNEMKRFWKKSGVNEIAVSDKMLVMRGENGVEAMRY